MAGKKTRKSRTSLGREGHPKRIGKQSGMARLLNQLKAHKAGKRTRVTIQNTKSETNARMIKVDGLVVFGEVNARKS
jgi:hypothetical protein